MPGAGVPLVDGRLLRGRLADADSERWRLVHVTLGETMVGLVLARLLWGVVGSRYARFSQFVRGPRETLRYLRSLVSGEPASTVGHNPAGAWAIIALLLTTLLTATAAGRHRPK